MKDKMQYNNWLAIPKEKELWKSESPQRPIKQKLKQYISEHLEKRKVAK
jgi:hypothetical protein